MNIFNLIFVCMYNYDCTPCLALCVHILKNEKNNIIISSTYIKSTLFRSMNISQSLPTKQKFFLTRTFIGVRLSGLRRSCTLKSEVEERLTFSFCTQKEGYKHIYISVVITIVTQSNTAKFIRMLNVGVLKCTRFGRYVRSWWLNDSTQ